MSLCRLDFLIGQRLKVWRKKIVRRRLEQTHQDTGRVSGLRHGEGAVEMANEAVGDFLDAAGACAKPTERRSAGSHVPEMKGSQMVHA